MTWLAAGILCPACGDWLAVHPETEIAGDDLYSSPDGFRTTISGMYTLIGDTTLYGGNLMFGYTSLMGHNYSAANGANADDYTYIMEGTYDAGIERSTGFLPQRTRIWANAYKTLATCNDLIARTRASKPSLFTRGEVERDVILGEALAARGLLHLDLVRLFAPAPVTGDATPVVPYVSRFPEYNAVPLPATRVLDSVIVDLTTAARLLARNDTVERPMYKDHFNDDVADDGSGIFFTQRGFRLNYVAVTGLLARAYLYKGDKTNALRCALEALKFKVWFPFTLRTSLSNPYTMSRRLANDVLFGGYCDDTFEFYNRMLPALKNARSLSGQLFANDVNDYRYLYLTEGPVSVKWKPYTRSESDLAQWRLRMMTPVIRMSEMYYIAAECMAEINLAGATALVQEVRVGRGAVRVVAPVTLEEFMNELELEYCREFLAEGQTVFFFKRLGRPIFNGNEGPVTMNLVVPVPGGEYVY
jgi:hypothetical protein